ncbi:MAG: hypothetical protein AAGI91_08860 [Bacteroidota bacterium]
MTRLFLLSLALVLAACGSDYEDDYANDPYAASPYAEGYAAGPYADAAYPHEAYADSPYPQGPPPSGTYQPAAAGPATGGAQRVTIMDRGLGMPSGTQLVPAGWHLTQNLATDPNTGQPVSQVLDLQGPRGELVRNLGLAPYGPMMGTDFEQTWRQLAQHGVQLGGVSFGHMQRSASTEALSAYRRAVELAGRKGFRAEALEAPVQGSRDGQAVQGFVYVIRFTSPQMPGGVLQATAVLSPSDLLPQTLQTYAQASDSYQPNPAYEQRMEQISQAAMQRQNAQHRQRMASSQAQHQQRMAQRQASFNAHQQRMAANSAAFDMHNQAWQNQQRSNDEMHRRTVNSITGSVDLYDANTGDSYYGVESGYDSYWTDQGGTVVGTEGYDNPDPMQYNQATDYDDLYDQGGYDDGGW